MLSQKELIKMDYENDKIAYEFWSKQPGEWAKNRAERALEHIKLYESYQK